MAALHLESRFPDPDRAYRSLIEAHRGLSDEESAALNTRLVLILANHVGDHGGAAEALLLAQVPAPRGRRRAARKVKPAIGLIARPSLGEDPSHIAIGKPF